MKSLLLLTVLLISTFAKERIVTLSPAINEIVYALGAGDQVVANTEYCTYPKASLLLPKVGGYFSASLEKVVAHKPTLVLVQKNNEKLALKLEKLGIKTGLIHIDTLTHIKEAIIQIGSLVERKEEAKQIVINIDTSLDALKNIVTEKKILIVIGHNTSLVKRIFVAGQNLYFDNIIQASGNSNALQSKRKGQPILNRENLIATNPDIVILLAPRKKAYNLQDDDLIKPWKELPVNATKHNNIYIIDKHYAGIPSDRLVYFIEDFKAILTKIKAKQKAK
ncbi:MAG: helical backbone metal receptor [Campylobacterota bacterium]|nr:helical backbone metal receptor [Campylobacterota bacterium]